MTDSGKKLRKLMGFRKTPVIIELIALAAVIAWMVWELLAAKYDIAIVSGFLVLLFLILLVISISGSSKVDKLIKLVEKSGESDAVLEDISSAEAVTIGGKAGGGKKMATFGKTYIVIYPSFSCNAAVVKYKDIIWAFHFTGIGNQSNMQSFVLHGLEGILGSIEPYSLTGWGNAAIKQTYELVDAHTEGCLFGSSEENRLRVQQLREEYQKNNAKQ